MVIVIFLSVWRNGRIRMLQSWMGWFCLGSRAHGPVHHQPLLDPARPILVKLLAKCLEAMVFDRFTYLLHQLKVIVQVVDRIQLRAKNLPHPMQVMQITAGEIAARVAPTGFIEWLQGILVRGVTDLHIAETGE